MFDELLEKWFGIKHDTSKTSQDLLYGRVLGEVLPVSIGTSLIADGPAANPSMWNDVLFVNLLTLSRNVIQSIPAAEQHNLKADDVVEVILAEMDVLIQAVPQLNPNTVAEFYLPDYKKIYLDFPMAKPREFNTKNKIFVQTMMLTVRDKLEDLLDKTNKERQAQGRPLLPVRIIRGWELEKDNRSVSLLTSFPTDLLSQYRFPKMNLVESHTGAVKLRRSWNTKLNYHKKEDIENMPFNKFTLQVFGDNVFFIQQNLTVKRLVVKMSQDNHWTVMTTDSTIRNSIRKLKHKADQDALLQFF